MLVTELEEDVLTLDQNIEFFGSPAAAQKFGKEAAEGYLAHFKEAKAAGEKSVEMIHVKDINKITGYIRGGCTAIGMKKDYPTVLDESANAQEKIIVSGGKNGIQIELTTEDYLKACKGKTADITLR